MTDGWLHRWPFPSNHEIYSENCQGGPLSDSFKNSMKYKTRRRENQPMTFTTSTEQNQIQKKTKTTTTISPQQEIYTHRRAKHRRRPFYSLRPASSAHETKTSAVLNNFQEISILYIRFFICFSFVLISFSSLSSSSEIDKSPVFLFPFQFIIDGVGLFCFVFSFVHFVPRALLYSGVQHEVQTTWHRPPLDSPHLPRCRRRREPWESHGLSCQSRHDSRRVYTHTIFCPRQDSRDESNENEDLSFCFQCVTKSFFLNKYVTLIGCRCVCVCHQRGFVKVVSVPYFGCHIVRGRK